MYSPESSDVFFRAMEQCSTSSSKRVDWVPCAVMSASYSATDDAVGGEGTEITRPNVGGRRIRMRKCAGNLHRSSV